MIYSTNQLHHLNPTTDSYISQSVFTFQNTTVTSANSTSFFLSLNLSISNAGPFDSTISFGTTQVQVSYKTTQMFSLSVPDINTKSGGAVVPISQWVTIYDMRMFQNFAIALTRETTIEVGVSGVGSVSALGISVRNTVVEKTIDFVGKCIV